MTPGLWLPFSWALLLSTLDVFPLNGLGCWKRGGGRELGVGGVVALTQKHPQKKNRLPSGKSNHCRRDKDQYTGGSVVRGAQNGFLEQQGAGEGGV